MSLNNSNYILSTKLPWPGDSKGPLGVKLQLAHVSTIHDGGLTLSLSIVERQTGKHIRSSLTTRKKQKRTWLCKGYRMSD